MTCRFHITDRAKTEAIRLFFSDPSDEQRVLSVFYARSILPDSALGNAIAAGVAEHELVRIAEKHLLSDPMDVWPLEVGAYRVSQLRGEVVEQIDGLPFYCSDEVAAALEDRVLDFLNGAFVVLAPAG